MSKRMLIDSSHPEETRVVVLDGQKVDEFDFEADEAERLKAAGFAEDAEPEDKAPAKTKKGKADVVSDEGDNAGDK